jgi:pterin-4a-carbinolamine dehydratase
MKEELDQQLCEKYPKIFVDRRGDMMKTLMCWGFEHGDGWYNIINHLCANIQHHIDWSHKNKEFDLKWNTKHLDEPRKIREPVPQVIAVQVKEKFGTLRFYYNGGDDTIGGMVRMAESMSSVTCEECGAPGETRGPGWIRTLCDEHEQAYQARHEQYAKDNGLEL